MVGDALSSRARRCRCSRNAWIPKRGSHPAMPTPVALDVGRRHIRARLLYCIRATAHRRTARRSDCASSRGTRLGGREGTPTREPGDYWQVRLSARRSRRAASPQTTPLLRTLDVVLMPMSETGNVEPLTRAVAADSDPVWSPDGRTARVSFAAGWTAASLHACRSRDQDAADQIVPMSSDIDETPTDWRRRSGPRARAGPRGRSRSLDHRPSDGCSRDRSRAPGSMRPTARLSPDGRWMAYVSDESGQRRRLRDAMAARAPRVRVSFAGGTRPRWARDGRRFVLRAAARESCAPICQVVRRSPTPREVLDVPGVRDFDVAHRRDALIALGTRAA